jgi:hypothetical protein
MKRSRSLFLCRGFAEQAFIGFGFPPRAVSWSIAASEEGSPLPALDGLRRGWFA